MSQGRRIQFIDSARGIAMLFVLLSHFGFTFFPNQSDRLPTIMRYVGMVASPSFVLINGVLIGFLCRIRSAFEYRRLRVIFVDRALFLLTIGHVLLLGSHAPAYTLRFFSITDTIAVCLLISPTLADRVSARGRVVIGSVTYVASAIALRSWHPHSEIAAILEESTVGSLNPIVYNYAFPILPWFSLNCFGSALGDVLGRRQLVRDDAASRRLVGTVSTAAVSTALLLNAAFFAVKHARITDAHRTILLFLIAPFQKSPPGPAYLLCYGAVGLTLILGCAWLESTGVAQRFLRKAAQLGEASLFLFIFQFYVYLGVIMPLNRKLPMPVLWPLYFVASAAIVIVTAFYWQKKGYNRLLTVGYRPLLQRLDEEGGVTAPQFGSS